MSTTQHSKKSPEHLVLVCRTGSRAYGTDQADSDEDTKGIFLPPKHQLYGIDQEIRTDRVTDDQSYYSLRHYIRLCTGCRPNALELLFCDDNDVLLATEVGDLLREERFMFLTKACIEPYVHYAEDQLELAKKAPHGRSAERTALVERHGYDTKFAYHVIRLLETAIEILTEGVIRVRRPNADFLIEIRNGKFTYDEFAALARSLIERVRSLEGSSTLPDEPNRRRINSFCVQLHELGWSGQASR